MVIVNGSGRLVSGKKANSDLIQGPKCTGFFNFMFRLYVFLS